MPKTFPHIALLIAGLFAGLCTSAFAEQTNQPASTNATLKTANAPTNSARTISDRDKERAERLQELRNLTPEQRRAKAEEFRAQHPSATNALHQPSLNVNERRERLKSRVEELRRKKANGTITAEEAQQLQTWENRSQQDATVHHLNPPAPQPPTAPDKN